MKRKNIINSTAMAFVLLLLAACIEHRPKDYHEKEFGLSDFTGVELGDALRVEIIQAEEFKVIAKGEGEDVSDLELRIENGVLMGHYRKSRKNRKGTMVQVFLPKLKRASMHSATSTSLKGFNSEEDSLEVSVSAASDLTMESNWKFLDVQVSGASKATIKGTINEVRSGVAGDSELEALGMEATICFIEVNGKSKAGVKVLEELKGEVNGKSELSYAGSPLRVQVKVDGDSKMVQEL